MEIKYEPKQIYNKLNVQFITFSSLLLFHEIWSFFLCTF